MKKNLNRFYLSVGIIILLVAAFCLSSALYFRSTVKASVIRDLENTASISAERLSRYIHSVELGVDQMTRSISSRIDVDRINDEVYMTGISESILKPVTKSLLESNPLVMASYFYMNVDLYAHYPQDHVIYGQWYYLDGDNLLQNGASTLKSELDESDPVNDWYFSALRGTAHWSKPYIDPTTDNVNMISYLMPVFVDGVLYGMAGVDIRYEDFIAEVDKIQITENGYSLLLDHDLNIIIPPTVDGKPLEGVDAAFLAPFHVKLQDSENGSFPCTLDGKKYLSGFARLECGQIMVVSAPEVELFRPLWLTQLVFYLIGALGFIAFGLFALVIVKYFSQLSTTDSLTGLSNRRHLLAEFANETERAFRYATPLSALFIDLDHFKKLNDTLGHDIGDEALKGVAGILKKSVRKFDCAARWGGEEFLILCRSTDFEPAMSQAERIRSLIEQMEFSSGAHMTCSVGITTLRLGDTLETLICRADSAMYQAKTSGRNRVVGL